MSFSKHRPPKAWPQRRELPVFDADRSTRSGASDSTTDGVAALGVAFWHDLVGVVSFLSWYASLHIGQCRSFSGRFARESCVVKRR
jgi:hypothetical protein